MSSVEKAVLGCILQEPHLMATAIGEGISPDSFTDKRNSAVFAKMTELYREERAIDGVVLYAELQEDPELALYSTSVNDDLPYVGNLNEYISLLRDSFIKRKLEHGLTEISSRLGSTDGRELLAHAERVITEVSSTSYTSTFTRVNNVVDSIVRRLEDGTVQAFGVSTGYHNLDRILHGLHTGNLVVVAGRPGMGKSAFAFSVARNVAKEGTGVALISLEMSSEELGFRLLSFETGNSQDHLKAANFGEHGWKNIAKARAAIAQYPLYLEDHGNVSLLELQSNVRRLHAEHNIGLVIVDYMQLMDSGLGGQNRNVEIGAISRGLKLMARGLNIPIIALSQLSRNVEGRQDKRPQMPDLRESGNIEQDADIILFIYREGYYTEETPKREEAEIIVAKNRNGRTGTIKLMWEPTLTRFENIKKENA
jgi:replicative DNA helicase